MSQSARRQHIHSTRPPTDTDSSGFTISVMRRKGRIKKKGTKKSCTEELSKKGVRTLNRASGLPDTRAKTVSFRFASVKVKSLKPCQKGELMTPIERAGNPWMDGLNP
jgi:hypothetical protein